MSFTVWQIDLLPAMNGLVKNEHIHFSTVEFYMICRSGTVCWQQVCKLLPVQHHECGLHFEILSIIVMLIVEELEASLWAHKQGHHTLWCSRSMNMATVADLPEKDERDSHHQLDK